jgi:hypothetical protein
MHSMTIITKHYGNVRVHHNGDWSGEVIVHFHEYDKPEKKREVELPAALLLFLGQDCAFEHMRTKMICALEQLDGPDCDTAQLRPRGPAKDNEMVQVGDLPSWGDCWKCGQPVRVGAHDHGRGVFAGVLKVWHAECGPPTGNDLL